MWEETPVKDFDPRYLQGISLIRETILDAIRRVRKRKYQDWEEFNQEDLEAELGITPHWNPPWGDPVNYPLYPVINIREFLHRMTWLESIQTCSSSYWVIKGEIK